MANKINFKMTSATAVSNIQLASDAIFAHATESLALSKAKKNATAIVEKALKDDYNGEISALRDAIRTDKDKVDAQVVEALAEIGRIDYKRLALSKWYKETIEAATAYFRLDDIIDELGANNLEDGVAKVASILTEIYGLDKVSATLRKKFARRIYTAMDGKRKATPTSATKGVYLTDRSRREIKEIGIRAMCEYVAHTANITLKTKEDYTVTVEYSKDLVGVVGFKCEEC